MAGSDGLIRLCDAAAVGPEAPVLAVAGGRRYAVFEVDGGYFVTQDVCTHGPGSLSDGYVEDGEVECPLHQGRFDIRTGQPMTAPCTEPLRVWTVQVHDGAIMIDPAQGHIPGHTAPA